MGRRCSSGCLWRMSSCLSAKWESERIPNQAAVLSAMPAAIPHAGLNLFPGMRLGPNPTMAQRHAALPAYRKKCEQSPHGFLVYCLPSRAFHLWRALAREGALNKRC